MVCPWGGAPTEPRALASMEKAALAGLLPGSPCSLTLAALLGRLERTPWALTSAASLHEPFRLMGGRRLRWLSAMRTGSLRALNEENESGWPTSVVNPQSAIRN